jgi:pyrroloquinoline quinone biosynthesis protein B
MRVAILGSAAGGGFPQWNCACRNCSSLRAGSFAGKARSQAQIAITDDGRSWFLLGASPDLRAQIEAFPELHPRGGIRQSPIAGVVLSSGDLDQVLGLLLLRELQPLRIYATASIRRLLREDNLMFAMLNRAADQARWTDVVPGKTFALASADEKTSGLMCETIPLSSHYPAYVPRQRAAQLSPCEAVTGIIIQDTAGNRLGYFPAVPDIDDGLLPLLESTDLLFFDGTFWSDDELKQVQNGTPAARVMGHVPISPVYGSLRRLAELRRPHKVFFHINNTNPMLDESRPEYREVIAAGWEIAEDGWSIQL